MTTLNQTLRPLSGYDGFATVSDQSIFIFYICIRQCVCLLLLSLPLRLVMVEEVLGVASHEACSGMARFSGGPVPRPAAATGR